jgi:GT2 family glycosyltransferase
MASFMSSPEGTRPVSVAAVIFARRGADLPATIESIQRQVYETQRIIVVGGDSDARQIASAHDAEWIAGLGAFIKSGTDATHLWFVLDGVSPRPDALGALVRAQTRLDASVAGSKILDELNPERLLSVGFATDVFETPYAGFDDDERDQGQYDVVRDVAAVGGQSTLIRTDLARGLGGPDASMAPFAAAVDFCQRARLRGARVIAVPSSEVLARDDRLELDRWRERAGRIRAMIKVYGPLTLLWALPMAFLSGFAQSFLSLFLGRWRFFHWLRSWLWNLVKLPNTLGERRAARKGRVVGDPELFRYQISGSVALKSVAAELSDRIRRRLPGEDRLSIEAVGDELRRPSFVVGALALAFVFLATRSIWSAGLPAVGFSLPFVESGPGAISAYAGGWNPAGLGSVEMLRPFTALAGLIQTILLDNRRLAEYVLTAGSWLLGIWGVVRLLRTWGVRAVAGTLAGIVYVAGPAAQAVAQETAVGVAIAIGLIPWSMRFALAPFPTTWVSRLGRIAALAVIAGISAMLAPLTLAVPVAALFVWALLNLTDGTAWRAFGVSLVGAVLAVPMLFPWLGVADLYRFVTDGEAYWAVPIVTATVVVIAAAATLVAAPKRLALVAGWGAIATAGGTLLARSAGFGAGREIETVSLAVVSLGIALIVGPSFEAITRVREVGGWRRIVAGVSVAAAVFLVAASTVTILGGRAGYPGDEYRAAFTFSAARPGDPTASRILVLGAPGNLPGDDRLVGGAAYRLVSAPMPESWETHLHTARVGDDALAKTLEAIIDGETKRAGELLAPFGVRWIVILAEDERDPFADAWKTIFVGQLDLVPLGGGLANATFESEAENAVRAISVGGSTWTRAGTGYEGTPEFGVGLEVRENANDRWGPGDWQQIGWANGTTAAVGTVGFDPIEDRRAQAIAAAVWLVALSGVAWAGRRFG